MHMIDFSDVARPARTVAEMTREALDLYGLHRRVFAEAWESAHAERGLVAPACTSTEGEILVSTFLVFRVSFERGEVPIVWCSPN
jgi:hypothetical protein